MIWRNGDWSGRAGRTEVSLAIARCCKRRRTYLLLLEGDDDVLLGEDVDVGVDEDWEEVEVGVGVDEVVSEGWEDEDDCAEGVEESVDEGVKVEDGVEDDEEGREVGIDFVGVSGDCEGVGEADEVGVNAGLLEALSLRCWMARRWGVSTTFWASTREKESEDKTASVTIVRTRVAPVDE